LFMTDATQACGKIKVDVNELNADLLCLSAHKFYGPKGAGALFVRRKNPRVALTPLIDGGGHEKGLRSGTLNVPAIAGFGKACELAMAEMNEDEKRIRVLRDELEAALVRETGATINGNRIQRMYNVTNLSFGELPAAALIADLRDLAVATGSACTSAIPEPSHVLKAMNVKDGRALSSIRFSPGKFTTPEEIRFAIDCVIKAIKKNTSLNC